MDSVNSGKVVEDYDNKTQKDGEDDNAQMEAMFSTDEKIQKKAVVMEKEMGSVVGGVIKVEVNKGCVGDPERVVEPECDGTVKNADQTKLQALVNAKFNTKGVEEAIATEVNLMDELVKHKVSEVNVEEDTINDADENKFENEENTKNDDQGLVTGKHITKGVEVVNTTEVNHIVEPGRHKVTKVDIEKETRKDEDGNKFKISENAKKDDEGVATTKQNIMGVEEVNAAKGLVTAKYNTKGVEEYIATEVNRIDELVKHKITEVNVEEETINDEDDNTFENAENAKNDDQGLVTGKHNTKDVELADAPEVNLIDEAGRHNVPEVDIEKESIKDEDGNKSEISENAKKDDKGLAMAEHITEETNEADVPELKETCRDVSSEDKVCEESAKEGVINNEHLHTYEVSEKGKSDDDAADLVDITSLNIDDQGSVDMPPNTVETDIQNDEPSLDEADIKTITAGDTPYTSATAFEDLNLSDELLRGLYTEMGFQRPSKIQAITLPMILRPPYLNLVAQAHNGSGKTTCFVLGMLSRIDPKLDSPQALCVCPTRELAIQNREVLEKMGKHTGIGSTCAIPTDIGNYVTTSRRATVNEQVVIGTPGTVKKWISNKVLRTRNIEILVFDEADHMLAQDGFQDDSLRIMKDIQKNRDSCQILLFSATFNDNVKMFISRMIPNANQVFVKEEDLSLDAIKQYCVKCPSELAKIEVLKDKIFPLAEKLGQTIIFVRTRESASRLHSMLEAEGHKCTSMQGRLKLEDRDRIIREFRSGITRILISTDVIARGFDQAQVTLVVNFDLPVRVYSTDEPDYEVYLHRIGRSGRFGRKGAAFNFIVTTQDEENMTKIERHFQRHATEVRWDNEGDFESAFKDAGLA